MSDEHRPRWRRGAKQVGDPGAVVSAPPSEIDPTTLTGIFRAPLWLRDIGFMSWLVVGIALLGVAMVTLLALTQVIVGPVITASIVAAVASPLVAGMARHGIPRARC